MVRDYGALEFSPMPAVDTRWAMLHHSKGNLSKRVSSLYGGVHVSPLDLMLSHHFFVPVFESCGTLSVSYSRPIRMYNANSNYSGDAPTE